MENIKKRIGIVIPCFNEALRIDFYKFGQYLQQHPDLFFCFVNDGSTDQTKQLLAEFVSKNKRSSMLSYSKNCGKAEAVRLGIVALMKEFSDKDWVGFWDADLATPLNEIEQFKNEIAKKSDLEYIFGSRWIHLGSGVERTPIRKLTGFFCAVLIRAYLQLPLYDSQCGTKLFKISLAKKIFAEKFCTRWLFDVEIFKRVTMLYSSKDIIQHCMEKDVASWQDIPGSKLGWKNCFTVLTELTHIAWKYRKAQNRPLKKQTYLKNTASELN